MGIIVRSAREFIHEFTRCREFSKASRNLVSVALVMPGPSIAAIVGARHASPIVSVGFEIAGNLATVGGSS